MNVVCKLKWTWMENKWKMIRNLKKLNWNKGCTRNNRFRATGLYIHLCTGLLPELILRWMSSISIPMTNNKKTEFCKCLYKRYLSTGGGVILYHKKITYPPVLFSRRKKSWQEGYVNFLWCKITWWPVDRRGCNFTS